MNTLYIATAFYNGCVVSDSIRIVVDALPSLAGSDTAICAGQFLSLTGNTLSGASYQWQPANAVSSTNTAQTDFIALQSTQLHYTVSRSGCKSIDTLQVEVTPLAESNFSFSNTLLDVSFVNSSMNYDSLYWDFGDGSAYSNSINPQHLYAQNGLYPVCLYTYSVCGTDSFCANVNLTTVGIAELVNKTTLIKLSTGYQLINENGIGNFSLLDNLGRCIATGKENGNTMHLDLTLFARGSYFLRIQNNDKSQVWKLVW